MTREANTSKMADEDESTFLMGGRYFSVTKKRWSMMALVCIVSFVDEFSVVFFAVVSDVASTYYRASPAQSDLLSTINILSRGLSGLGVATIGSQMTFRRLMLTTSVCIFTGSLLIATGVSSRRNFPLVIMGQILSGFSASIALVLPQVVTANWFSSKERGKVFPFPRFSRRLSNVVSSIVSTYSLGSLVQSALEKSENDEDSNEELMIKFQTSYTAGYLGLGFVSLVMYFFSVKFVSNNPPSPSNPEVSPYCLAKQKQNWSLSTEVQGIMALITNKLYVIVTIQFGLMVSIRPLTDFLLTSLVLRAFPSLTNQFSGLMFSVGHIVGAFGSPLAGLAIHKFQRANYIFFFGVIMLMVSCVLFALAMYIGSLATLYTGYILMAFFRDVSFVCIGYTLIDILQTENSGTRVQGFVIAMSLPWALTPLYAYLVRLVMDFAGPSFACLFPIPFQIFTAALWQFL